jgi:hypothetical protein
VAEHDDRRRADSASSAVIVRPTSGGTPIVEGVHRPVVAAGLRVACRSTASLQVEAITPSKMVLR